MRFVLVAQNGLCFFVICFEAAAADLGTCRAAVGQMTAFILGVSSNRGAAGCRRQAQGLGQAVVVQPGFGQVLGNLFAV